MLHENRDFKANLGNASYCIPLKDSLTILKDAVQKTIEGVSNSGEHKTFLERFNKSDAALSRLITSEFLVGEFEHQHFTKVPR